MEELYDGKINEFVDWVTGENVRTHDNVTDSKSVSGGRIRELLLSKLREPFIMKEDPANNLYRLFSSEEAYNLWADNPSDNADLLLFTIPRPSDYKLNINITNNGDRYIKVGDDTNPLTKIQFDWRIYNDEGDSSDGLTVTYTIYHVESGSQKTFSRRYNKGVNEDLSIYSYLKIGENRITIEGKGNTTGARNSTSFNINLLLIKVSCDFNFASQHIQGQPLRVPYVFERNNINGSAKIYFIVDNEQLFSVDVMKGGQTRIEDSGKMISPTLTEGQHSLLIYAESIYNDGLITVLSNLLYFTFTVASQEVSVIDKFINIATSYESGNYPFSLLTLSTTQYYPTTLRWGYYTYAANTDTSLLIIWKLLDEDTVVLNLGTVKANTAYEASKLSYIPEVYTLNTQLYIAAYYTKNSEEIELVKIPIYINQNSMLNNIYETDNYELKMSAYGRTNESSDKNIWKDVSGNVTTTFTNIDWTPNSGWYNNSFRTIGTNQYAIIDFKPLYADGTGVNFPFDYGKTIEIEFESEKVSSSDDKLIVIGNPVGCRIEITPNKATLYDNTGTDVIHTNYKINERIKLAFIINKVALNQESRTVDDGLVYIVNNGILERGTLATGRSYNGNGPIKIGGSNSGIRVYNIRVYDKSITYTDAYNNYVFDSEDKVSIVTKNNIISQGNINYELCLNIIDTIRITGDLSELLVAGAVKTDADVMIERTCPYDLTKDFTIGELIDDPNRLDEKIVVNGARIRKHGLSTLNYPVTSMKFWTNKSKAGHIPIFSKTGQEGLLLNKNRYKMKNSSIPANKFILQANYADSSGVHNGGLLRLIQKTWYNAKIDGLYRLRTEPQLFTSIKSSEKASYGLEHVWLDYFPKNNFPYDIEVAPDSFPCTVFYYDLEGSKTSTFLGLYVFMEDKKSDYCYGERSIYRVVNDPFCLTVTHKDDDTSSNKIWNNDNVLRIEVLEINDPYSSYQTTSGFEERSGNKYGWESSFEMIYPDPDDIEGRPIGPYIDNKGREKYLETDTTKFGADSEFRKKAQPFINWYKWVVSTKDNQLKFEQEAADHLDLYKMAAYYIFCLRFGLVDSTERNAQIKTYDGVHFHYEPWDMDIALGNKNTGGIAFDPPIDRDTKLNSNTYAFSGKSNSMSNWLWDALEAWSDWANVIVPEVAQALYDAGLTYDNVIEMLDKEYQNKWCEIIYNESGHFKYVEYPGSDLNFLQGARTTHRHWWLSTSMDYYDAKWFCGDYKKHSIYIAANADADENKSITITPNSSTYMTVTINYLDTDTETLDGSAIEVTPQNPFVYNLSRGFSDKAPVHIYGANFMESIDLSNIANGLQILRIDGIYSDVLGTPLKTLILGTPISGSGDIYTTKLSPSTFTVNVKNTSGNVAIEGVENLNIRGHMHFGDDKSFSFGINSWIRDYDMSLLKNFYAMGSNLINFYSSDSGNNFNTIELPSTVAILNLKNSTWLNLEFWDTTVGLNDNATLTKHSTAITGGGTVNIPSTLMEVHFLGSTGRTRESLLFIRDWIKSIVETEGEENLWKYTLEMDDVCWTPETIGNNSDLLTYDELALIYKMNGLDLNKVIPIRGYVTLKYEGEGTELTALQLTQIRTWFGDTVFTKGSSGLVVDYMHSYIQINIGGQVTIDNGEVYLREGDRAMLSATQFLLSEGDSQNYSWGLSTTADSSTIVSQINGVSVLSSSATLDGNTYLMTSESLIGQDYDVYIRVTAGGTIYSSVIHIIAAKYPTNISIECGGIGNVLPKTAGNMIALWLNGMSCDMFVLTQNSYTATIRSIVYTVSNSLGRSTSYSTVTGPDWSGDRYNIDERINVQEETNLLGMGQTPCVKLNCISVPNNSDIFDYTISAVVTFISDKQMTASSTINVMNDSIPIVSSLNSNLYIPILNSWATQFGTALTKLDLYRVDLMSLTGTINFSIRSSDSEFTSIATGKSIDSLLKYLPNVTGLIFDNCTHLTSINSTPNFEDNGNQFIFDKMSNLLILSIQNCTGLTEDIDLTNCPNITQVDASGTTVSIIMPQNPKVTKYEVGAPTSINLENPTVLTPAGIKVSSYENLNYLVIKNIPNVKSYTVFGKIMKNLGAEVILNMYIGNNGQPYSNSAWNCTTEIYAPANAQIKSSRACQIFQYGSDGTFKRGYTCNANDIHTTNEYIQDYDYIIVCFNSAYSDFMLTDITNNKILVKYEA